MSPCTNVDRSCHGVRFEQRSKNWSSADLCCTYRLSSRWYATNRRDHRFHTDYARNSVVPRFSSISPITSMNYVPRRRAAIRHPKQLHLPSTTMAMRSQKHTSVRKRCQAWKEWKILQCSSLKGGFFLEGIAPHENCSTGNSRLPKCSGFSKPERSFEYATATLGVQLLRFEISATAISSTKSCLGRKTGLRIV